MERTGPEAAEELRVELVKDWQNKRRQPGIDEGSGQPQFFREWCVASLTVLRAESDPAVGE
jgi:hypothetical protein